MGRGESQSVGLACGSHLLSVDVRTGEGTWEFAADSNLIRAATVADTNQDMVDDVVLGSEGGMIHLVDGKSGRALWNCRVPTSSYQISQGETSSYQPSISDLAIIGWEAGQVVAGSSDGRVRLVNLRERTFEWESTDPAPDQGAHDTRVTIGPDANGDGLPEIIVAQGPTPSSSWSLSQPPQMTRIVVLDGVGHCLWAGDRCIWRAPGVQIATVAGNPAIVETDGQQTRLIDLASGEAVAVLDTPTTDGTPAFVEHIGGDRYLLLSDAGDLAVVSSSGGVVWSYPRIGVITTRTLRTADGADRLLFCCHPDGVFRGMSDAYPEARDRSAVRSLSVSDGEGSRELWSYQVPYQEFAATGGLAGVLVTPDIVGADGVQDIIGYSGTTISVWSGGDGRMTRLPAVENVTSLDTIQYGTIGTAIVAGSESGFTIMDSQGLELWRCQFADWSDEAGGAFRVLDDINQDGIGDLALFYPHQAIILQSNQNAPGFGVLLDMTPEPGWTVEAESMVQDLTKDGIRELSYMQRYEDWSNPPGGEPALDSLVVASPVDGKVLLKLAVGSPLVWRLAYADFNGDGSLDSVIWKTAHTAEEFALCGTGGSLLEVYSGADGTRLWRGTFSTKPESDDELPAIPVGDMNGDEVVDMALTRERADGRGLYGLIEVVDVMRGAIIKEIPIMPTACDTGGFFEGRPLRVLGDVDDDGLIEVAVGAQEPVMMSLESGPPGIDAEDKLSYEYRDSVAIVDGAGYGARVALLGCDLGSVDFFVIHQQGVVGMTAFGGICQVGLDRCVDIVTPTDGSVVGSTCRVAWEGSDAADVHRVFVDGCCVLFTEDTEATLRSFPGRHEVVVRSVGTGGLVRYGVASYEVRRPWWDFLPSLLASVAAIGLLLLVFSLRLQEATHRYFGTGGAQGRFSARWGRQRKRRNG